MNQDSSTINQERLQELMQQVGIANINELSQAARVARLQLIRIQQGLILNVSVGAIVKIAKALNISIDRFVSIFTERVEPSTEPQSTPTADSTALEACRQEYEQLQQEMSQLEADLTDRFQQQSLETIESWLLQWPTAATAVRQNPQLPATRLLSLVEPVEELVEQWNVSTIATVGEELAYDPQYHQLMKGVAQPGEVVKVRYVGYKQGDKLLYKAKVSPVN